MVGGRLDEEARAEDATDIRTDLRKAYERGRLDERARRRRHPFLMTITFLFAIVGLVSLALAAMNGSFARGGAMMDDGLSIAASRAGPAARQAADNARHSMRGSTSQTPATGVSNGAG